MESTDKKPLLRLLPPGSKPLPHQWKASFLTTLFRTKVSKDFMKMASNIFAGLSLRFQVAR